MSFGCNGEEVDERWTVEKMEEDFRELMKGCCKCYQEMKGDKRSSKLVIEHLQTEEKWVTNEKEAELFVGKTLEDVGDYCIVGGEEYIIYSTSDLIHHEDYEV